MKVFRILLFVTMFYSVPSFAQVGISAGSGIPFLGQVGIDYKPSTQWSLYAGYNILSLSVDTSSVELTMPEVLFRYHVFSRAFYVGLGIGQETLEATAVDSVTSQSVSAEVTAMTGIAKVGWMWGAGDNSGFWFGIDLAYIMPFGADTTITAPGVLTTSQEYQDVVEAADEFGETAYINFTFARLGFIF